MPSESGSNPARRKKVAKKKKKVVKKKKKKPPVKPSDNDLQSSLDAAAAEPTISNDVGSPATVPVVSEGTGEIIPPVPPAPPLAATNPTAANGVDDVASKWAPAARRQADKIVEVEDNFDYGVAFRMAFLGTGEAGGRMAESFWNLGYRRLGVLNTTHADFENIAPEITRLDLEVSGARKDADYAARVMDGREEEVFELMTRTWGNEVDYALICAGLGGGTGSGTLPVLVKLARQYLEEKGLPPRVGAVVSLPTMTEGQQVCRNAVNTFKKMLQLGVSPIIIIDNNRIHQVYRPPMAQLYSTANQMVSEYFHLFNRLCEAPNAMMTFDRSEFAQILDSGVVVMGAAPVGDETTISGPADIAKAIREQLTNNVLAEADLRTGHKSVCIFVATESILQSFDLEYFNAGFAQLNRVVGERVDAQKTPPVLHRGLYEGGSNGISVYSMIGGLKPPEDRLRMLARQAGLIGQGGKGMSMAQFLGVDDAS